MKNNKWLFGAISFGTASILLVVVMLLPMLQAVPSVDTVQPLYAWPKLNRPKRVVAPGNLDGARAVIDVPRDLLCRLIFRDEYSRRFGAGLIAQCLENGRYYLYHYSIIEDYERGFILGSTRFKIDANFASAAL